MIKRQTEQTRTVNEHMRGGDGSVIIESIIGKDEMYGKGRLFARIILNPGCSIGVHTHENEMETFYITKGTASYEDDGQPIELNPGDTAYTPSGHSHAIANRTNEPVEFIAVIIYA